MDAINFFQGQFSYPVPSAVVETAMVQRGINADDDIMDLEQRERDLVLADLLTILARSSQGYTNTTGSDAFNMSIKGVYIPLADRREMRAEANRIYKRYGETANIRLMSAINIYEKP